MNHPCPNPEIYDRGECCGQCPPPTPSNRADDAIERVWAAIEAAQCPGREGPFGGYDYGHNPAFYGPAPEDGRYVVRDFRDPASPDWGKWVHQTDDREEHEATLKRMTQNHIARAAVSAIPLDRVVEALTDLADALEDELYATDADIGPVLRARAVLADLAPVLGERK